MEDYARIHNAAPDAGSRPTNAASGCDVKGAKRVWRRVGPRIYSWYFDARSLTGFLVSPNAGLVVSLVHISSIFRIVVCISKQHLHLVQQ